ncbi:MAG: hypothetical protein ACLP8S_09410 [Solirubrobacteraceae bacterium]
MVARARAAAAALLAGALILAPLAGCGASSSRRGRAERSARRISHALADKLAQAARTHEVPTPAPRQRASGGVSAAQEITTFATIYINWTAQSVAAQMTELARASVGQARSEMALAAAETGRDSQLREAGIANSGIVEAVVPLPGQRDRYVVVTRESTSATNTTVYQGLGPAWHVTVATILGLSPGRWVVSGWQPQS